MGIFDQIDETGPVTGDDKNRLFQTIQKSSGSSRKYLKLLGILGIIVILAGALISYLTLPRFGDAVRAPMGLEAAVRDHFLVNEKRTSTDTFITAKHTTGHASAWKCVPTSKPIRYI